MRAAALQPATATPGQGAALRCDAKVVATLRARAALAGISMCVTTDDAGRQLIVLSKWARCYHARSIENAERFIRGVGGPAK